MRLKGLGEFRSSHSRTNLKSCASVGARMQICVCSWQEFLLRIIADAFDLPPQALGLERDVNRNTAAEMTDQAFRQAIVPTARLLTEHLTRDAITKKLGWSDLEFVFTDVDSAGNAMEQAQIQEILLRNGVLTVNEVRQMRGLPPV